MASDGAPQAIFMLSSSSSSSSSSRDSEMASKLQSATSLTIRTLQEITDNFSDQRKIGQGSYGKVYHAKLENGEEIAVKILHNNTPGIDDEQFKREFEHLMRLDHQNIVRLVRYCYETQHEPMQWMGKNIWTERTYRALCFEYMHNGSLQKHISDECDGIDWFTRYQIIKGTWMGLKHLHEGFSEPIYHLDLKLDNILLDKNMMPKLADFGLSKLFSDKQTMTALSPAGTIGYLPMEFLSRNIISNKFDIFSLGVVMIKIISGNGGYSRSAEMTCQEFLDQVHENWRNRMLKTCQVSRTLEAYCEQVNICTRIALSCVEIDRHKRPTIADIIHRLNGTETVIAMALSQTLMNENLVKLEAFAKSEAIPYADSCDEYPILVRVTAPPWRGDEEMSRPGVDLVVVMHGDPSKYRFRAIKKAVRMVIDMLGSKDRLSILLGNGDCVMELKFMSNRGRTFGRRIVEKLSGDIICDPAASVREGAKVLRGREMAEGHSRVGFIMILLLLLEEGNSDTLMPETSSEFPVHVVSFDRRHVNHDVARYIADQNSGIYSSIERDFFDERDMELFIGGIIKVSATSIDITITAHEGIVISSIDSGGYSSQVKSEGRCGEIHVNDIFAGETKNFIVNLKLAEGKSKLVTISGQYQSLNASKKLLADTDVLVLRPSSECSPEKLAMHPEMAEELVRLQVVKGVSLQVGSFRMYGMEVLWQNIRLSEEGQRASQEALAGLVRDTQKISQAYYGTKSPDLLSWLSCHKWQRATTKGSYSVSDAFTRKC